EEPALQQERAIDPVFVVRRPPAKFWRHPDGAIAVLISSPASVDSFCRQGRDPGPPTILGCAFQEQRVVVLPNPCLFPDPYAQLVCHEMAHINGWGADHVDP